MTDEQRCKEDLIDELNRLRRRITELESGLSGVHPFITPTSDDESVKKNGRQKEVAPSENEARFRSVLDSSRDVIYRLNLQTRRYEYISPSAEVILGYSPDELMAMDVEAIHSMAHPNDLPGISTEMMRLEENGAGEFIYRQRTKTGHYRWLSNHMSLTRDRAGQPLYRDGSIRDITKSKSAAELLRESEDRYQSLVNLSPDAILVHAGGKYIFANPAAVTLFGASSPAEIVGREVLALVHPDQRQAARDRIEGAFSDNLTTLTETKLMRLDGKPVDVELTGVGIEFGGNPARQIVVRDITERKRIEKELEHYRYDLEDMVKQQVGEIQRQAQLLDVVRDAIIVRAMDGTIQYWNAGAERMYGYPRDMAVGQESQCLLKTCFPKPLGEIIEDTISQGQWSGELTRTHLNGGQVTVLSNWVMQWDELGNPMSILETNKDITVRKALENKIWESEERLRMAMESLVDGFAILSAVRDDTGKVIDFVYEYANQAICLHNRLSKDDLESHRMLEVIPSLRGSEIFHAYRHTAETGEPAILESLDYWDPGRPWLAGSYDIRAVKMGDRLAIILRDVTDRKQTEEALRISEERFSTMFRASPIAMTISTYGEGRYIDVNNSFLRITGYSREEVIGHTSLELKLWSDLEERTKMFSELARTGELSQFTASVRIKSGEMRRWQASFTTVSLRGEKTLLSFMEDITDRHYVEEALRASEERFAKAFQSSPMAIAISTHPGSRYLEVNDSFLRMTGYARAEVIGRTPVEINLWIDLAERERAVEQLRRDGYIHRLEMQSRFKDGSIRTCLLSVETVPVGGDPCLMVIYDDITERRKMEAEMARLDRLNLVGQVAASLGHEVRNPMTTVRGYLQLMQEDAQVASYHEDLSVMIEEMDRANNIITEFLTLAQNKRTPTRRQDLNTILKAIEPLMSTDSLKTGCAFNLACGAIPEIILDEKEIRQLVINLVRNGIEAAPTGAVNIKTFLEGKDVVLEVSDTGQGIPAEVLDRLGTPFLTTKEGGTGLGLATSYSIARRHGATITPESGPGGTTFSVRFPVPNGVA